MSKKLLLGALGTLTVVALASTINAAKMKEGMEKCAIVGTDGSTMLLLRDCASSTHSCAGKATNPTDWIIVPKGTCAKIKGGKVAG